MSKRAVVSIVGILLLVLLLPQSAAAQSNDADTLIALVNQLRADYGLPPYQVNVALMSAAQAHTDWAASVGTHSHIGQGGTTYEDRIVAAGYGPRDLIHVGENIYWGTDATAQTAFDWWRGSSIHFQNMTSTDFEEIGAGVASNGSAWFYTLNFGRVGEDTPGNNPGDGAEEDTSSEINDPEGAGTVVEENGSSVYIVQSGDSLYGIADKFGLEIYDLRKINGMNEDQGIHPGDRLIVSISAAATSTGATAMPTPRPPLYHTVVEGDTALGIALLYGIEVGDLYTLNDINDATVLFVGDQLLIREGDPTPTPTPSPTPPPTITPVATITPTPSLLPTAAAALPTPAETPEGEAESGQQGVLRPLLIGGLIGAVIVGAAMGTFALLVRRRAARR
ncbi:MAG: LysM peptidoglycan-binding domain-containing protein [Anaerolineae bacterium]|nr:LysM peptidoglycan-binding domain-containing protein [Anaerolineae bacterium]